MYKNEFFGIGTDYDPLLRSEAQKRIKAMDAIDERIKSTDINVLERYVQYVDFVYSNMNPVLRFFARLDSELCLDSYRYRTAKAKLEK